MIDWANNPPEGFDWDPEKYAETFRDHGVGLETAILVFGDPFRIEDFDDRDDYGEDRFFTVGLVWGEVLRVAFTLRGEQDETTRIITAFKASVNDRRAYERNRKNG